MACANGCDHTIFLSEEGILHGFGNNNLGQLGKGDSTPARIPTRILHLPKIKLVSCGAFFTVCADEEGSVWSFGLNFSGQLGTGSTLSYSFNPSKIQDIPPVHSISCGYGHTLMITEDLDLWSFGMNEFGQLFSEEEVKYIAKARRTFYHNVSKISAGGYHYFKMKKEQFMDVDKTLLVNLVWELMPLKWIHAQFSRNQILFNSLVELVVHYFLMLEEMYFLLACMITME